MNSVHSFIGTIACLSILNTACLAIASAETVTAQSGNVRAELSYQKSKDELTVKNLHLKIIRAGQTLLDKSSPTENESDQPAELDSTSKALQVRDLDGDREPEVLLNLYTGGPHCCTYTLIYRYERNAQKYSFVKHDWGNSSYSLEDLDRNGMPKFTSSDDAFAYAFTFYAASARPIQIWQYRRGQMLNVTRRYPKLIYSDATYWWQQSNRERQECQPDSWGTCSEGILAAYLADKYLLGQQQDGWQRVQQVYQGRGCQVTGSCAGRQAYFNELRKFLRENGYASK